MVDETILKVAYDREFTPPARISEISVVVHTRDAGEDLFLRLLEGNGRVRRAAVRGHHEDILRLRTIPVRGL